MNFKKQISIFLALFILIVNSSASLVLHFCHNEISYISLVYQENSLIDSTEEDSCCAPEITDKKQQEDSGCCSNEEIKVEKKIDYTIFNHFDFKFQAVIFDVVLPVFKTEEVKTIQEQVTDYYCDANAPPLYKLYSQYIFYA